MNKPRHQPPEHPPSEAAQLEQEAFARKVLETEAEAVSRVTIDAEFHRAVEMILGVTPGTPGSDAKPQAASGRSENPGTGGVVVTGLGKSNFIGQKISATFASTGTPSHFLHPTEAMHGDLGRIRCGDVVLALSYSGNTEEVVSLAALLRQDSVPVIAMTGKRDCDLARLAAVTICIGDVTEACPLNLAPTASTTAMLALGDALALCVSRRRDFGLADFKKVHPGGGLGRQLMPVVDAMRFKAGQNLPLFLPTVSVEQAFAQAEQSSSNLRRPGALLIVDDGGKLTGIFTDGDLRRAFIRQGSGAWREPIGKFMKGNPRRLPHTAVVRDAVQLMREFRIDEIPVVDGEDKPLGLVDVQDLMALKVIEG